MSDDITIRGGGVVAVDTEEHLRFAALLLELGDSCASWADRAESVSTDDFSRVPLGPSVVPQADARAGSEAAARAAAHLRHASEDATRLGGNLILTAENYGQIERQVQALFTFAGGVAGWAMGASPLIPLAILTAVGEVALIRTAFRAIVGLFSSEAVEDIDEASARSMRELVSSPAFVALVRGMVSGSDEFLIGLFGLPVMLDANRLREQGITGVAFAASVAASVAQYAGVFTPAPVQAVEVKTKGSEQRPAPPTTYEELVERMPHGGADSPQIRIERYQDASGADQWIVWTGGTIEAGFPESSTEPWDNRSNVTAVAHTDAESLEATLQAMRLAGIPEGASVLHVGYSQGGIVASGIAASGLFDSTLVTFGSPVESFEFDDDLARTHVEHTEDVIPALSGERRDSLNGGTVVQRSLYDGGTPPPGDDPLPAHNLDRYRETARLIDQSSEERLTPAIDPLAGLTGTGEAHQYRADKVLP
ncbi:hypothetical protein [Plantibacter sp. LMC-P-059a]|uniref:hypothetical protein n=1 Tax=Plantibacter sp. LMC-P-059a TaxID=3040297 RepID=UPI00254DBDAB|nr:hypothetical protein [Plantibacter sp. LMC-P-059a]